MMMSHPLPGAAAPENSPLGLPFVSRNSSPIRARAGRWRPGLKDQPLHSEIFASGQEASGAGLALAFARDDLRARDALRMGDADDRKQVLWVQDRAAIRLGGRPYIHGLPADLRHRVLHVAARTPEDALFAMEEGLKCRDLVCVIGEVAGNPRALNFTTSRRLSLAAEKHGVALWLVRLDAQTDLSSARMRWRVGAAPSPLPSWNPEAPGMAQWQAELFRARRYAPGEWMLSDDAGRLRAGPCSSSPDCGGLADGLTARSLAAG